MTFGLRIGANLWRRFALALLAVPIVLSACIGSGFTYVANGSTNAYFKVPSNWRQFTQDDVFGPTGNRLPVDQSRGDLKWFLSFDADPSPSVQHVVATFPDYPVIIVRVHALDPITRDNVSLETLRNSFFQSPSLDELISQQQAQLVSRDESVVLESGTHGSHLVYDVVPSGILNPVPASQVLRVNQISLIDPAADMLYVFVVRCTLACYSANKRLIDEIVQSWSVKEP